MVDLVGTCPQHFWREWIAEGDAAGDPYTGEEWGWYTGSPRIRKIEVGDRFYVVAHGMLRGYAPVTRVRLSEKHVGGVICRRGGGVAVTIPEAIPGFRGLRERWWPREAEIAFEDWKTRGVR